MNLTRPINYLARKLLYLWINTEIKQTPAQAAIDSADKIYVYVLESRAWSDLLVLEHECVNLGYTAPRSRINHPLLKRHHHVYSTAQARPVKAWINQKPKRSKHLQALLDLLIESPEIEVSFIPVMIYWGRPVLKQKHWLRVLFSDTWGFVGRMRQTLTILLNGKATLVEFSTPVSGRQLLMAASASSSDPADYVQQYLGNRLIEMKTATLGPDISHRRTLLRNLMNNPEINDAITQYSEQHHVRLQRAQRIAQKDLDEIIADRSYITIQILQRILSAFWNRFYSGIDVYHSDDLKTLAQTHELVYVPCHRSHIDYLLLSYVIHFEGLAIPYIAAGKNLNMPLIGPILRKGGAFFIRRSFKGDPLYTTVMFEYLASQLSTGMPIEYFIEGGRSRTGRLMQPRAGMLAMTIRAFLKYQEKPIAFVPAYIGYEKMIESKSYLAELKGDDKKTETLLGSIASFVNLRGFYGRVSVSFGQPVLLSRQLSRANPEWAERSYDDNDRPDWLKDCVHNTASQIMRSINASCAVNAINLVSTALLASPNQTMDEKELATTLSLYKKLIQQMHFSSRIMIPSRSEKDLVATAEDLKMVKRRSHELGDFIYLDREHAVMLTYYRNNILHLFIMPSLIACCFINATTLGREKVMRLLCITYPFLKYEFFLPWKRSEIEGIIDRILHCMADNGILEYHEGSDIYTRPRIDTQQHMLLTNLSHIISPVLELYYMIFALLAEQGSGTLERDRLEQLCRLMAQRLSLMYEINSPDFFDKKLIANFIDSLIRLGYIQHDADEKLEISGEAIEHGRYARRLLDKSMQYNILQMLRSRTEADQ